ncbi:hypothetical protein A2U01_0105627, partial [Trifolium medium]|nr:hypothetical protein [Trifolium medium]
MELMANAIAQEA